MTYYLSIKHTPRIRDLLTAYMVMIDQEMNGPLAMFNSHGMGIWGAREWYNQPRSEAYLWDAMLSYIESTAGPIAVSRSTHVRAPAPATPRLTSTFLLSGRRCAAESRAPGIRVIRVAGGTAVSLVRQGR
jgi:hypothetical protein